MSKKNSPMCAMDKEWQAESDMNTLARAEEIRKDPKRLAAAKEIARKKLEEIASVASTVAKT